jgi:hypothetical protein
MQRDIAALAWFARVIPAICIASNSQRRFAKTCLTQIKASPCSLAQASRALNAAQQNELAGFWLESKLRNPMTNEP